MLHASAVIESGVRGWLAQAASRVASAARLGRVAKGSLAKGAGEEEEDHAAAQAADQLELEPLAGVVKPELVKVAKDAARAGLHQVTDPLEQMLSQADERAVSWAEERSGELITEIAETTRARVRELVARAEDEGWSNDELADEIQDDEVFGGSRAEMVARTETAMADVQGSLLGWKESGVVESREWSVADANECDLCSALDGEVVPLDGEFPDGDPPLHPRCRCTTLPVLKDDEPG